jgi:hypothetical protein
VSATLHDEGLFGRLAASTSHPSKIRVIHFSLHSPHPLAQKILDTGFRLLMVLKITELVLTLEGVVEGGGGESQFQV